MTIRLRLSRAFGGFWWRRRDGWYGRFVESAAYPAVMPFLAATGLALVLVVLGFAVLDRTLAAAGWSVVAIGLYLLATVLLTSFGASVTQTARHDSPPALAIERARELLLRKGFVAEADSADRVRALRGSGAGAESSWRDFPMEIEVSAKASDGGSMISVRCTGESGRHRFIRSLIARTSQAVANLDPDALQAIDKTLVQRPGVLFQGGLGTSILGAMLGCAVLGTILFVGASYLLGMYVLNVTQAKNVSDELRQMQVQLTAGIDAALRAETERLAARLGTSPAPSGTGVEVMRTLAPFSVPGELVTGVADAKGRVLAASTGGPHWTQEALNAARKLGLARLGNAVVRELPAPHARGLETSLGLKPGQLLIGASLAHADLARFAPPRMAADDLEITFFDSTRSFLRYTWRPGKPVQVDAGSSTIPADVLASAARRLDDDWSALLRDLLSGGDVGGIAIRSEVREGAPYRVYYSVAKKDGAQDAWDGVSIARVHEPMLETREWLLPLAIALGLIAFVPLLIATVILASTIANRISRPALQLRGALRSLGEGDYAVRLQPSRSDEIGRTQAELSRTAEQLERRKADRRQ
ncbi:MAG TPA: HAMP domain-containing protein [Burkholderiales bacterium]|nr:HAMP domain-containing protein [Burkholderiales bacterium]